MNKMFDGDSAAIFRIHSTGGKQELLEKAFIRDQIKYDHNDHMLHNIKGDGVYCVKLLLSFDYDLSKDTIIIEKLEDLPFTYELIQNLDTPVQFNNEIYTYGQAILNKLAYQDTITIYDTASMDKISKLIYARSDSNADYHKHLCQFNRQINWILNIHETRTLTLPVKQSCEVLKETNNNHLIKKLPKNPLVGVYVYEKILNETFGNIDPKSNFSLLSKTKFKRSQMARSVITIGYVADASNIIQSEPIHSNLLRGLDEDSFFKCGVGTRKGLNDKQNLTPQSGYLARTMSVSCSPIEIAEDDCGCNDGFKIQIKNKQHLNSLAKRYVKLNNTWVLFKPEEHYIGKELEFRSPITCQTKYYKICKHCFGEYPTISPFVGVIAGQCISEVLTQLTLRSFHSSGSSTLQYDKLVLKYFEQHLANIINKEDKFDLIFNEDVPQFVIDEFETSGLLLALGNTLTFANIYNIANDDVGRTIAEVKQALQTENKTVIPIIDNYNHLMSELLNVSEIYSVFLEIILSNLYVDSDNIIYRYQPIAHRRVDKKYSVYHVSTMISPLLAMLYTPNNITMSQIENFGVNRDIESFSILERLWLNTK